jgi:hypothetical protein
MRLIFLCVLSLLLTGATSAPEPNDEPREKPKSEVVKSAPSRLYIASGTLISGSGAPIELRSLHASIEDGKGKKGCDPKAAPPQVVSIADGNAFLSDNSLNTLLNAAVAGHSLQNIKVSSEKGKVKITGTAQKTIPVAFSVEGPVTLTPQGLIRLKAEKVSVADLPGLADLLGLNPKNLTDHGSIKGVQAQKDAILFDPDLLWGLPVHGRVTRLVLERNGLLLTFGNAYKSATGHEPNPASAKHHHN